MRRGISTHKTRDVAPARPGPMIYRGRGGARILLTWNGATRRGQKWWFRFLPWLSDFGPFDTKIRALIEAAHACGRSGAEMDWEPERADLSSASTRPNREKLKRLW